MITLTQNNVKELEAFIVKLPYEYAAPLLQYLSKIAEEQKPKEDGTNTDSITTEL